MKRFAIIILSPLLCLGVLAGMWAEARTRVQPADAMTWPSCAMRSRRVRAGSCNAR